MAQDKPPATREAVARAAVKCFKQFGVHRTSMIDVAKAANLSRQTVYRLFEARAALLEYIATQRIQAMGEVLKPYFAEVDDLEEALVEGSMRSMAVGAKDRLYQEIVAQSGEHQVEVFTFKGSAEIQQLMVDLWSPVLNKARERGQLVFDMTNEEIVEWIRNQHAMLFIRDDYDEAKQRQILSCFLVPSLLRRPRDNSRT
ncbi:MAG TPA: helix-turn-helix domain-containing protein [Caulobacteraceae bacterium]